MWAVGKKWVIKVASGLVPNNSYPFERPSPNKGATLHRMRLVS